MVTRMLCESAQEGARAEEGRHDWKLGVGKDWMARKMTSM